MTLKCFVTAIAITLLAPTLYAAAPNQWRAMDSANHPSKMFQKFENHLIRLPLSGRAKNAPWSDNYWPSQLGGAAQRWQTSRPAGPSSYQLLTQNEVAALSDAQLMALSPAEKFDIVFGDYTYSTVNVEKRRTAGKLEDWYGLCHAVAAAATNFYEPQSITYDVKIANQTRAVTLYSSDVKAILALATHFHMSGDEIRLGNRCNSIQASADGPCWDANPASFFLAVTNVTGLLGDSLVIDVDDRREVWNSAIASYSARVRPDNKISSLAAVGTVSQVQVDLTITHALGTNPSRSQVGLAQGEKRYKFTLELDASGRIIGGEWVSSNRPDFMWISKIPRFTNLFAPVEQMVTRF